MNAAASHSSLSWSRLGLGFALFLGATRLAIIGGCAPLVPYWDEWSATAALILKPWHEGHHVSWAALWAPHNDHRIVLTRLWEIGWFSALGEWDPTVVATVNALILTGAQAGFVIWAARKWTPRTRALWLVVAVVLLAVPFGYANLLVSFQSQFHFLAALGLIALVASTQAETNRWAGPLALVAAALALFSTGAGLLIAVTIGVVTALQTLSHRCITRRTAVLWAGAMGIFLIGWSVRPPASFAPTTPARTALATTRYASWPASNLVNVVAGWPESARYLPARVRSWPSAEKPAIAAAANFTRSHPAVLFVGFGFITVLTFLPAGLLLVRLLRAGEPAKYATEWALVGIAVWSGLNALGMAAARSGDLLVPPRYQDLLVLGLLANAGSLFALTQLADTKQRPRLLTPLAALWSLPTGAALAFTAFGVLAVQLPRKALESAGARATVQAYVASGDRELFRNRPTNFVPSPGSEMELAQLLTEPAIRALLPVELRATPVAPSALGRFVRTALRVGPALAGMSAILLMVLLFRHWKSADGTHPRSSP